MSRFFQTATTATLLWAGLAVAASADDHAGARAIFNESAVPPCAICHTLADADSSGEIGPNLDDFKPSFEQVRAAVTSGIGVMPAYEETLSADEIEGLARYVAVAAGGDAAAPAEEEAASDNETTVAGDAKAGEKAFAKCKGCHTVDEGGKNRVGPNLYGIVGAPVAAVEGFKYSPALTAYGGDWTPERLDAFLANPRKEVPKTKMGFAGLKKQADRANIIAYLQSLAQ